MPRRKVATPKADAAIQARLEQIAREAEETDREVERLFSELYAFFRRLRAVVTR